MIAESFGRFMGSLSHKIMIKSIRRLVKKIKKTLVLPMLLVFIITDEQAMILSDVRRWVDVELMDEAHDTSDILNLLTLLALYREFRNLYYFRAFKGNLAGTLAAYATRVFYRPEPTLFIRQASNIGRGLFIQHGFSTVINATIGDDGWINQQVSIGYNDDTGRTPVLGKNVRIGAGAKVLGPISVGDNVRIGANAVVVKNVPPNCTVVGVPAYIVKKDGERVTQSL